MGHTARRENLTLGAIASAYFLLLWLPSFVGPYGYFIDELYYIACSKHLAFGYVDHPPLSIAVLWVVRMLFGDSLPALRLVPALAGTATVLITGLIARRFGADAFGQALAAGSLALGGLPLVIFSFYSMNALAALIWAVCFWILVEIERRDEPRLWIAFGVAAGLGLQNKHTIVLLACGLAVGLLLTPARRHLASRWLWIGVAVAGLILLPNLLWQQSHDWLSLEFYRNADRLKNVPTPPLAVLGQQLLFMNPAAAVVWIGGIAFFLFRERGRPYRHLGILFVTLMVLMLVAQKSRPDRILAAYAVVFAGGGALLAEFAARPRLKKWRMLLPLSVAVGGGVFAPLGVPVFPPDFAARYGTALGLVPQLEKGEDKRTALPQWLADRLEWPRFVHDVSRVVASLDSQERSAAIILAPSYGQAGALEHLGRGRDLPPVYATHNNYFLWGPPQLTGDVVIVIGWSREDVESVFETVELAHVHECDGCMPWRNAMPIWIARKPKLSLGELWPRLKNFV